MGYRIRTTVRRLHVRRTRQNVVPVLCHIAWRARTWPVPPDLSTLHGLMRTTLRLRHDTRRNICDMHESDVQHSSTSLYQGMGRRLIDFSERFAFLLSSPVQSFLDIHATFPFFFFFISELFLLLLPCIQRPDQVCQFFPLHLWEVRMSGILKTDQPHGYEQVYSAGFIFPFFSFLMPSDAFTTAISSLSMACHS